MSEKYFLESNYDNIVFEVNDKIINSSILLKNMFEFAQTSPNIPIGIECSSSCLKKFIDLIKLQEDCENDEEKYNAQVIELFKDFTDSALADFIEEACILDSDILLDAIADVILDKIKDKSQEEITNYLEIEDDFTPAEREWQSENMLEYFISLNDPSFPLQFPLPTSQRFYAMKTKFSSPLNILLSRICQRADETITFLLSFCSKLLKNECDRHPIKVSQMSIQFFFWCFDISNDKKRKWRIPVKNEYDKYFSAICKRCMMVWNDNFSAHYGHSSFLEDQFNIFKKQHSFSLEWIVPHKNVKTIKVTFGNYEIFVSNFDVTKLVYSHVSFSYNQEIDFDFFYNHLIAKDLSKEVELHFSNFSQYLCLNTSKRPNAAKFYSCHSPSPNEEQFLPPKFIAFLKKYMESNGRFEFLVPHPCIPEKIIHTCSVNSFVKYCFVSDILQYLS